MIIGLTGRIAAGKGEIADYFKKREQEGGGVWAKKILYTEKIILLMV